MARADRSEKAAPMTWSVIQPCSLCGCNVLLHRQANGKVDEVTPVCGDLHLCGENCACRWATAHENGGDASTGDAAPMLARNQNRLP